MRPTVAEVSLGALSANYKALLRNVLRHAGPSAGLVAVVKADAYGHDAALCGRALVAEGAPWLGVTCVEEAVSLHRALGAARPRVLVMSGFFPGEEALVLEHRLTPQMWENYHFALLDAAARRRGLGPASVPVHLEIETGMARQGVAPGEALAALLRSAGLAEADSPLFVEGVMTHFSSPDEPLKPVMGEQVTRFGAALEQLRETGVRPRWVHAGNSANASAGLGLAALRALAAEHGAELLVRPGLALYGIETDFCPAPEGATLPALQPVLRWRTEVTSLRAVPAGAAVGYNETFRAERPMRLALAPVGYADGLSRSLSNRGAMLVRGRRTPVVGRVSMDQTVLDVSAIPGVELGDEVVILGRQGAQRVSAGELAELCGTIPYEVLCAIGPRVRRVAVA